MNSLPTPRRSASGFDLDPPTDILRAKLEGGLKPAEAEVLLRHGTEAAFCGGLLENKADGVYCCRLCGLPLFRAATKFDSGTGWPSFFAPYDPQHLVKVTDRSYGMIRVEIRCARCGSHQGHVFPDGPPPTRERYCINSVSLSFVRAGDPFPDPMDRGDARVGSRDA